MSEDFRGGAAFPRRGRQECGGYLWLARIRDKARAAAAGTLGDYIYPCPTDRGVLAKWRVPFADFDDAARRLETDEALAAWLGERVDDERRQAANAWLLRSKTSFMNRQDYDERIPGAQRPPLLPYDIVLDLVRGGF